MDDGNGGGPRPLILGFDTSGSYCSAALAAGGDIVAAAHEEMGRGQAERLMPMLEDVLARGGAGWADLSAVGVGTGPGNFTGVRISVAAARGLALALAVPALGVDLFDALAFEAQRPVLVCLSAPRGLIYVRHHGPGASDKPLIAPAEDVAAALRGKVAERVRCRGPAAQAIAELLDGVVEPAARGPGAAVALVARSRLGGPVEHPRPVYLRPADAAPPRRPPPAIVP